MGNVNEKIQNNYIDSSDISVLTQNITNKTTQIFTSNQANCSNIATSQNNCEMDLGDINVSGDGSAVNIGGELSSNISTNFSCINDMDVANQIIKVAESTIQSELQQLNQSSKNKLALNSTSSNNIPTVSNNINNNLSVNVENIAITNLSNNITSSTVSTCVNRVSMNNNASIQADGIDAEDGGIVDIGCRQSNNLQQIVSCKALSDSVNKSITDIAKNMGLNVVNSTSNPSNPPVNPVNNNPPVNPINNNPPVNPVNNNPSVNPENINPSVNPENNKSVIDIRIMIGSAISSVLLLIIVIVIIIYKKRNKK